MIEFGAETLVVPGNLPIGCSPSYLTYFMSSNESYYDSKTGCLNWLNEFAEYHNKLLQETLHRLRELHPHVTIIYADYYNAAMELYNSPSKFGMFFLYIFTKYFQIHIFFKKNIVETIVWRVEFSVLSSNRGIICDLSWRDVIK